MTADAAKPDVTSQSRAKIFISYSRKDIVFADRLEGALKSRGFEPLIDRTDIYAFEDWWKRIEALIARADTVVSVLGRGDEARAIYLQYRDEQRVLFDKPKPWETAILEDFAELRLANLTHPLMNEIEALFAPRH
jgi:TIR domain